MSALCLILRKQTLKTDCACVLLCSESVGLTSLRGDMQPTISWQAREWLYICVCIINTDATHSHSLRSHLHVVVVEAYCRTRTTQKAYHFLTFTNFPHKWVHQSSRRDLKWFPPRSGFLLCTILRTGACHCEQHGKLQTSLTCIQCSDFYKPTCQEEARTAPLCCFKNADSHIKKYLLIVCSLICQTFSQNKTKAICSEFFSLMLIDSHSKLRAWVTHSKNFKN